jgi:hypothetical protein
MDLTPESIVSLGDAFLAGQNIEDLAEVLNQAYSLQFPNRPHPRISRRLLVYLAHHMEKRYYTFEIPKKSGGVRVIQAPIPKLKMVQQALNICFQCLFVPHKAAYGFVPGKNIVENARLHTGRRYVYNVDLKDFFPSTSFRRVKTVLALSPFLLTEEREPLAFLIANLCCAPNAEGQAALPQGAPTSPTLTNVVCQRLDRKLNRFAREHKTRYTRYADDLTFSSNDAVFDDTVCRQIEAIIEEEGYHINVKKVRIQSLHIRQEVTGLTVNKKPNVRREYVKDIRYWLRTWRVFGYEHAMADLFDRYGHVQAGDGSLPHLENILAGKIAFLGMVRGQEDEMVRRFRAELQRLMGREKSDGDTSAALPASAPAAIAETPQPSADDLLEGIRRILKTWAEDGLHAARKVADDMKCRPYPPHERIDS